MDLLGFLRAALGVALLAYVPGRVWTPVIIPSATGLQREIISIGIALATMTLGIFVLNAFFNVPIRDSTAIFLALAITLAGLAVPAGRSIANRVTAKLGR